MELRQSRPTIAEFPAHPPALELVVERAFGRADEVGLGVVLNLCDRDARGIATATDDERRIALADRTQIEHDSVSGHDDSVDSVAPTVSTAGPLHCHELHARVHVSHDDPLPRLISLSP